MGVFVGCIDIAISDHVRGLMICTVSAVNPSVEQDPDMLSLIDRYYLAQRETRKIEPAPVKTPYFAYTACAACHAREDEDWHRTLHASAVVTLRSRNRTIPLCLSCHSERYRTLNNLAIGQDDLQAVECASCHSDVLPHDSKPTKPKTDMKTKCLSCHNQERSPNFDYNKYIKLVSHKRG